MFNPDLELSFCCTNCGTMLFLRDVRENSAEIMGTYTLTCEECGKRYKVNIHFFIIEEV